MTWPPVALGVQSLLIQIYLVLLSTLLSIDRQQLSLFDAHSALLLSSSPLTIYLVVASIGDLFGIRTGLYKRIKSYHLIISILGGLVLLLWTGLSMTTSISTMAFKDSSCYPGTFVGWFKCISRLLSLFFVYLGGIMAEVGWVLVIP